MSAAKRSPGLYVIFDGPPSHEAPAFIEVEDHHGNSVGSSVGISWQQEGEYWALGPFREDPP